MTSDPKNPRPRPRSSSGRPGPGETVTGRAGANLLRRRQEELIRYEMGLLETPFLTIRQDPITLSPDLEFVGSTGRMWRLPVWEEEAPVFRGLTSIDQMVIRPSDPGEPRRWTRFAARVVLGLM